MSPTWQRILIAGGGAIGVAIIGLLAVIAYALLSGDGGGPDAEVARITQTATASPTASATPRPTPSPAPPTATPEPTPEATPEPPQEPPPPPPVVQEPAPIPVEQQPPPTQEPPPPTPQPTPTPPPPPPTPTLSALFCPLGYTYDSNIDGCVPQPPFCEMCLSYPADAGSQEFKDCLAQTQAAMDRYLRGECRMGGPLCRKGQEYDPLQRRCVPVPG
jgi:hypothetical protein